MCYHRDETLLLPYLINLSPSNWTITLENDFMSRCQCWSLFLGEWELGSSSSQINLDDYKSVTEPMYNLHPCHNEHFVHGSNR